MGKPGKPGPSKGKQQKPSSDRGPVRGHITKANMRKQMFKKQSGNVAEGQGFADRKKKAVIRNYRNIKKKENLQNKATGIEPSGDESNKAATFPFKNRTPESGLPSSGKKSRFHKEEMIKHRKKEQKKKQHQEKLEADERKKEAMQNYKQKRKQNYRKLAKVNYKGQPNLASQMELLLDKIQQNR